MPDVDVYSMLIFSNSRNITTIDNTILSRSGQPGRGNKGDAAPPVISQEFQARITGFPSPHEN